MRRSFSIKSQRNGINTPYVIPAPVGGWNTRDAESVMDEADAVIMDNAIPNVGSVEARKGYVEVATGASNNVESLFSYAAGSTEELISASSSCVYKGVSGTLTEIGSGFGSARWDAVNFNGRLIMVNGVDTPQSYDGTTLTASTITGSGLSPSTFDGVAIFKSFVFYYSSSSQDFWYGSILGYQGAFTKFPLSRVGQFGGNLIKIETWNLDGGDGADDMAVFFMSSGDVILYKGTDPADADNWNLVGVFRMSAPLQKRAITKVGSDILIVTRGDFVLFSDVFGKAKVASTRTKLSGAIQSAVASYGSVFGWQVLHYPAANLIIINVPITANSKYHQYCINTLTNAACRFTGINARCFAVHNDRLYFGGNTKIYQADRGYDDDGAYIKVDVQQAYSRLGVDSEKTMNTINPVHKADANVNLNIEIGYDFGRSTLNQAISSESVGTPWGAPWESAWSPVAKTRTRQYMTQGQGTYVSTRLKTSLKGQSFQWFSTYYNYSSNAIL